MTTMICGKSSKDRATSELNIMILKLLTTTIQSIMAMIITQCMMSMTNTIMMLIMNMMITMAVTMILPTTVMTHGTMM